MRERQLDQMPILIPSIEHPRAEELQRISDILDENPIITTVPTFDFGNSQNPRLMRFYERK